MHPIDEWDLVTNLNSRFYSCCIIQNILLSGRLACNARDVMADLCVYI